MLFYNKKKESHLTSVPSTWTEEREVKNSVDVAFKPLATASIDVDSKNGNPRQSLLKMSVHKNCGTLATKSSP